MNISGILTVGWVSLAIVGFISAKMGVAPWELLYLHKLSPADAAEGNVPRKARIVQLCAYDGCEHWASNLTYAKDGITASQYWMNHWMDEHSLLSQSPYTDEFR